MKCKFIHLSDARGKIGGAVASKNRSGNYFRSKVSPVNPKTSHQLAVRSTFAYLSQTWSGLSAAEIASWNTSAPMFSKSNVFGDTVKPTGLNLFLKVNSYLRMYGLPIVSQAPIAPVDLGGVSCSAVVARGAGTLTLTPSGTLSESLNVVIKATPSYNNSVSYIKNKFRNLYLTDFVSAAPFSLESDFEDRLGSLPSANQKISLSMVVFNVNTGAITADIPIETTYTA